MCCVSYFDSIFFSYLYFLFFVTKSCDNKEIRQGIIKTFEKCFQSTSGAQKSWQIFSCSELSVIMIQLESSRVFWRSGFTEILYEK